jgi:hypothetical protein
MINSLLKHLSHTERSGVKAHWMFQIEMNKGHLEEGAIQMIFIL